MATALSTINNFLSSLPNENVCFSDPETKQFLSELFDIHPSPEQLSQYLVTLHDFLRRINNSEFTKNKTIFIDGNGHIVLDILSSTCSVQTLDLEMIGTLISCLAFITHNNNEVKEYLYKHDILNGVQSLLLHNQILVVFQKLFVDFDFSSSATSSLTNSEFVTALLSALLALTEHCEVIQKELANRGILQLLCQLLEGATKCPDELTTVFSVLLAIINIYVSDSIDLLPSNIVNILSSIMFEAQSKGISLATTIVLTSIATHKSNRFIENFIDLIPKIVEKINTNSVARTVSVNLFKEIAMDEQIPTYKLVPHINDLLNGIGDNEQFSQQCIEALNAIALRDDALSILSTKTTILTEKVQSSKDLVFSSLMLLLANMGRMDSTIEYYINSGIAETIINYVNDHPNDERSLMMTVSVLSAMSVRQTNRDYLAKTMNLFEVLNNWYYRTSNQVIIFNIQQVISRLILNSGERAQLFMNVRDSLIGIIQTATYTIRMKYETKDDKNKEDEKDKEDEKRDERVAYEATRILCHLIHFEKDYAVKIIKDNNVMFALGEMVKSTFDILRNEGKQALEDLVNYGLKKDEDIQTAIKGVVAN